MENTIITLPALPEPDLTTEAAEKNALCVIGEHFTRTLIGTQPDRNLDGYSLTAEICWQKNKRWNRESRWLNLCLFLATISLLCSVMISLWALIPEMIFSLVSFIFLTRKEYPGKTSIMIAEEWSKWRHIAHQIGLVENLGVSIRYNYEDFSRELECYCYDGAKLKKSLVLNIQTLLQELSVEIKNAERDGFTGRGSVHAKKRDLFGKTDKLGQKLGFAPVVWQKYLPKKK